MNPLPSETTPDIHFMHVTATTLNQICDLSKTLSPVQRHMVADNVVSIAGLHFSIATSSNTFIGASIGWLTQRRRAPRAEPSRFLYHRVRLSA